MPDSIEIDTSSFNKFAKDLKEAEQQLAKDLRKNLRAAGEIVAVDARRRASNFSTRIPGAIKVGVTGGSARAGRGGAQIKVYVDKKKAPHGRPIEGIGGDAFFRHPTDGAERQHWVNQRTIHYLAPAALAGRTVALVEAKKAVESALREVHSHG